MCNWYSCTITFKKLKSEENNQNTKCIWLELSHWGINKKIKNTGTTLNQHYHIFKNVENFHFYVFKSNYILQHQNTEIQVLQDSHL